VHQLESLSQCPAHHSILESVCPRCGHETPHRISVRLLEARYRCANCLAPYARYGWTPYNAQPMRPEHRKAFTRRYLERCRG
jgi:transposase-like protein